MMKRKRVIRVKDPRLRKIRLGLRTLLVRESIARLLEILGKKGSLLKFPDLSEEEFHKKYQILYKQEIANRKQLDASICVCPVCGDFEKDHIFNPVDRVWYCEKCYEILKKSYIADGDVGAFP